MLYFTRAFLAVESDTFGLAVNICANLVRQIANLFSRRPPPAVQNLDANQQGTWAQNAAGTEETVRRSIFATTILGSGLLASLALMPGVASADPVADFYKGKVVQIVIATGPGAQYDFMGRAVARHFGKYVPGNPTVTPQNMV